AEWTVEETTVAEATVAEWTVAKATAREVEELSVRFTGRAEATCIQLRGPRLDIEIGWLGVLGGPSAARDVRASITVPTVESAPPARTRSKERRVNLSMTAPSSGCRIPIEGPKIVASRPPNTRPLSCRKVYRGVSVSRYCRPRHAKHAIHA